VAGYIIMRIIIISPSPSFLWHLLSRFFQPPPAIILFSFTTFPSRSFFPRRSLSLVFMTQSRKGKYQEWRRN